MNRYPRLTFLPILILLGLLLACAGTAPADTQPSAQPVATVEANQTNAQLEIRNHSATDICGIAVSASDADDWGDNLLEDVLAQGDSVELDGFTAGDYDLLAVDCSYTEDDVIAELYEIALAEETFVWVIQPDDGLIGEEASNSTANTTQESSPNQHWTAPAFDGTDFYAIDCPFDTSQANEATCGRLVVPENRDRTDSPAIELAVVILPAAQQPAQADAIVYLAGGPGASALDEFAWDPQEWMNYPFCQQRDMIFVDQRGTGYSLPTLNCPEVEGIEQDYASESDEDPNFTAMVACHDRLVAEGVDLTAYNTSENAADIADLMNELGYAQWNILGISYGTRLGLAVMRDFPAQLRSVVLDSVFPPNQDLPLEETLNSWHSIQSIFVGCAADPACNGAYPNLEQVLIDTVVALNDEPITVAVTDPETNEEFDEDIAGDDIVYVMLQALYDVELIPLIPRMIYEVSEGNFDTYGTIESATWGASRQTTALAGIRREEPLDFSDSEGMYNSVTCHDDYAFGDYAVAERTAMAQIPEELHLALWTESDTQFNECAVWGAGQAAAREKQPVVSDVPTLILAGEYDPVTPPRWGRLAGEGLSQSFYFEFPGTGHSLISSHPCAVELMDQFFDDPLHQPDAACLADIAAPTFYLPDQEIEY